MSLRRTAFASVSRERKLCVSPFVPIFDLAIKKHMRIVAKKKKVPDICEIMWYIKNPFKYMVSTNICILHHFVKKCKTMIMEVAKND
jgi:hypothetical protein